MSFTEANRKRFDDMASEYDTKQWQHKMSTVITQAVRDRLDWIGVDWAKDENKGKEVRFLDYACGTGLVTRILGPCVTSIRGIDLSSNMVEKFNSNAALAGFTADQMSAVTGDLLSNEPSSHLSDPSLFNFDVAAVGLGFHHFEDVGLATERLVQRLKPGGVLFIIDFLSVAGEVVPQEIQDSVKVFGFNELGMRSLFEQAGLVEFGFIVLEEQVVMPMKEQLKTKSVFIARGRKPSS